MATPTPAGEAPVDAVRSADIFAQGMVDMLLPIVQDTDARVQSVFDAQAELQQKIQALGQELEALVEATQTPALSPYVHKLTQSKLRLENTQAILAQTKARLARLERQYTRP